MTWRGEMGKRPREDDVAAQHRPSVPAQELLISLQLEPVERGCLVLWLATSGPSSSWLGSVSTTSLLPSSSPLLLAHSLSLCTPHRSNSRKEADGCVRVIRAASSPDVVQLRVRRGPAGHVVGVDAAPVGTAPSDPGEDGQRKRGQGHLRAPGGGDAQHRRTQALQPAQGKGHRAALPGDHRVLQDHRRRPEAEAGIDPTRQEERREARIPCLKISSPFHLLYSPLARGNYQLLYCSIFPWSWRCIFMYTTVVFFVLETEQLLEATLSSVNFSSNWMDR